MKELEDLLDVGSPLQRRNQNKRIIGSRMHDFMAGAKRCRPHRNKARLIAHGNQQIFEEVFSSRAESPTKLVTTYNQLNPNKRADDTIRADVGIVVGRDNVRKGSYYVYDIHTMSTVSRHDIAPIGWNQTLLNNFHKVNKLAGAKAGDSVRFTYGNNKVSSLIDLQ